MSRLVAGLLGVLLLLPSSLFAQGALQRIHQGDSSPAAPPSNSTAAASSPHTTSSNSDSTWADIARTPENGEAIVYGFILAAIAAGVTATSPIWIPVAVTGDDYSNRGYFHTAPYVSEKAPLLAIVPDQFNPLDHQRDDLEEAEILKWWSVRASLEDGNDFRGMNRLNARLTFDTAWRIGVMTNWNYLYEKLDGGGSDDAVLGDTNVTFRFAQNDWMQMYAGVGLRVLTDRYDTKFGFNFLYGADFFPVKPLILSTSLDVGNLSSDVFVHGRGSLGVNYKNCEIFGGYDFMRLGGVNIQGPMVGVRLWF